MHLQLGGPVVSNRIDEFACEVARPWRRGSPSPAGQARSAKRLSLRSRSISGKASDDGRSTKVSR